MKLAATTNKPMMNIANPFNIFISNSAFNYKHIIRLAVHILYAFNYNKDSYLITYLQIKLDKYGNLLYT